MAGRVPDDVLIYPYGCLGRFGTCEHNKLKFLSSIISSFKIYLATGVQHANKVGYSEK